MTWKSGSWGTEGKERGARRKSYFSTRMKEKSKIRRMAIIEKFGGKCVKCGFKDWRALQVDHINGGGRSEAIKMSKETYYKKVLEGLSDKYQLLCANCNWIKRYENNETRKI